jgi:hypothetical protein
VLAIIGSSVKNDVTLLNGSVAMRMVPLFGTFKGNHPNDG